MTSLTVLSPKQAQSELQTYVGKLSETTSDDITVAITMCCDDPELIKIAGATYDSELILEDETDTAPQTEECILQLDDTDDQRVPFGVPENTPHRRGTCYRWIC